VRFVKVFGFAAACRRAGTEIRQLVSSLTDGESERIPVIHRGGGIESGSDPHENVTVSVVIPVKDAGEDFRLLLSSITTQKGFSKVEIVVVDSGSTDRSVETSKAFGAKVLQIRPGEFSHSYARNLAAEHASGDYILFMVQDALPSSDQWLNELFSALRNNDVAAVSCAEYPRDDADLFYRVSSWGHYRFLNVDKHDRIMSKPRIENYFTMRKNAALSNLACLMPRQLFLQYKFRGSFAEDLELGLRLIRDGHKLVMLSSTRVIHSHNRSAFYHFKRGYADVLMLCEIFSDFPIVDLNPYVLTRDIVFARDVIDSLVEQLARIRVGCSVGCLAKIVGNHYRISKKHNPRVVTLDRKNSYRDERFDLFLVNIREQLGWCTSSELDYDGVLLRIMQCATQKILDYMDERYELVDETLLDEFCSSLYKMLAFQYGSHLASCYAKGSEQIKRELEALNKELPGGV
jgi:glycosyltransferase involved in cell wall biosynthesis